jgi:hypothetical protein
VVCDLCNNGRLARLDEALVQFKPVATMRTALFIPGKSGGLPSVRFGNAHLSALPGRVLRIEHQTKPGAKGVGGNLQLQLTGSIVKPDDARLIVRALYKVALEFWWLTRGRDRAMTPWLDPVRRMVLGDEPFSGYLAVSRRGGPPMPQIGLACEPVTVGRTETIAVTLDLYGIVLLTDTHVRKVASPDGVRTDFNLVEF